MENIFLKKLKLKKNLILDGGTGTEIARLGGKVDSVTWSSLANITDPELIKKIHKNYIKSGVDIITTNTFSSCRHVLDGSGNGKDFIEINKLAVQHAKEARQSFSNSKEIIIAGSISNTLALKKGLGYPDPEYIPSIKNEKKNYRDMANILADEGVDVFFLEMMLDEEHSFRLLEIVKEIGLPVCVGLSCSETLENKIVGFDIEIERKFSLDKNYIKTKNSSLNDIINKLKVLSPDVFGIMHTNIHTTNKALKILKEEWNGKLMVYPEIIRYDYDSEEYISYLSPYEFSKECKSWLNQGISIIGGCCGTTPEHIKELLSPI